MSDYLSTENQVACLAQAIRNGEYPSIAEATRENPDLYGRVKNRVAGRTSRSDRPATNRLLSDTEEEGIMLWITRLNDIGQRPGISMLERFVNRILADRHTDSTKPPPTCGTKWATRFCKRQKVALRTEVPKEAKRQAAEDPVLVKEWFDALGRDIEKYAVQHEDMYNMDESGVRIGQGKKEKVLIIHNKAARCEAGKAFSRESVTITETICADGHIIPPFIIFKGKTHQMRWYSETTIPDSYTIGVSDTAYTNDEIALEWIKHFDLHTQNRTKGAYRLLILDGHGSHETLEFTQYCIDRKILLACFPAHLTHKMQPLDVVVFQPFKHWYGEAVNQAYRTGAFEIDKMEFLHLIPDVRKRTFKKATIKAAFAETGLYPFNPKKVLDKLPLPREATPEKDLWSTTIDITTPKTLRQASDLASYIRQNWQE